MQFTVLIEFLVPGLATLLLGLAFLPDGAMPRLPPGIPTGDTATALLLLAVSYPVGVLANFPVFRLLQQGLLMPRVRQRILKAYKDKGNDLVERAEQLGIRIRKNTGEETSQPTGVEIRELFSYMQVVVFRGNDDRLNANDLFYKSLRRLARGMLFPLLLAAVLVVYRKGFTPWSAALVLLLAASFFVCYWMLEYFLERGEDEIARFFVTSTATPRPTFPA